MCSNNNENNNNYRVRPEQQLHSRLQIAPAREALLRAILANRNIKSLFRLFRMHCAKLSSAGVECTYPHIHTYTYLQKWQFDLSLHFVGHRDWSCTHTHTHRHASTVSVQGRALLCSLGRWLRPKIVHEIMAVSAVCHILGHLWVRF